MFDDINAMCNAIAVMVCCNGIGHVVTSQTMTLHMKNVLHLTIFVITIVLRATHGAEHNAMFDDINAMCNVIAVMVCCNGIGHVMTSQTMTLHMKNVLHLTIFITTAVLRATHGAEHNAMFDDINAMWVQCHALAQKGQKKKPG
jgi:uncharacterized protein (DUF486 family)